MANYAEVIVSNPHKDVDRIFHYIIPEPLRGCLQTGMRVTVPFGRGNTRIEGYVIGFSDETDVAIDKLKAIVSVSEEYPVFSDSMIALARWMRDKYYTTLSECLRCILPAGIGTGTLSEKYVYLNRDNPGLQADLEKLLAKDDAKANIIKLLQEADGQSLPKMKGAIGCSDSPFQTLQKHGIILIKPFARYRDALYRQDYTESKPFTPNGEQQMALDAIFPMLDGGPKQPVLLHGVTGSGKTEVYLQVISQVLAQGKQAIVLVPEIALTPQTVEHFVSRFGRQVSVTHSRLSQGERFDQWRKAREGLISVMIGPRSAIFTPFERLGVIIVDEEHEHTYQSETTPKYNVKEVAVKRMELTGCLVVLGSATPSVETYYEAQTGRITCLTLTQRVNQSMPAVSIVDMRLELAEGNRSIFSRDLYNALRRNLAEGNQAMLFMNRRGHSTFVSCRVCGEVLKCDRCNINYTYHIASHKLICHYCGQEKKPPDHCPICGSKHIKYFGTGTQKVGEEIKRLFPEARTLRMDMDTTSAKHSHERILEAFGQGRADILIGTQMIAKGHDFPNVALVGIVAADLALNTGDFRSAETAYQLITQVAGRAGRAQKPGEVFVQTYNPEHYSVVFARDNDYAAFYAHEILIRKDMQYPPFTHIFSILCTGEDERKLIVILHHLLHIMQYYNRKGLFEMLGPSPAQISKINQQYRWRLFVKCVDEEKIKSFVFYCLDKLRGREDLSGISISATLGPKTLV